MVWWRVDIADWVPWKAESEIEMSVLRYIGECLLGWPSVEGKRKQHQAECDVRLWCSHHKGLRQLYRSSESGMTPQESSPVESWGQGISASILTNPWLKNALGWEWIIGRKDFLQSKWFLKRNESWGLSDSNVPDAPLFLKKLVVYHSVESTLYLMYHWLLFLVYNSRSQCSSIPRINSKKGWWDELQPVLNSWCQGCNRHSLSASLCNHLGFLLPSARILLV